MRAFFFASSFNRLLAHNKLLFRPAQPIIITESIKYFAFGMAKSCHCEHKGRGNLVL